MAVSARLSRRFQQALGAEAAQDLVHWMEHMDAQREDVRLLIARIGEWREAARADVAELRQEMHTGDSSLRADLAGVRADVIKWSFVFWAANLLTMLGVMVTLTR